jgi:phosphoribosylaminoimidazole-succinocarboxamide synthase
MKKPIIEGSSKQFFSSSPGTLLMTFKDCIHGASREAEIAGTGYLRQAFTYYFLRLLEKENIPTHLTSDPLQPEGIVVKRAEPIKLEIIVRNIARGHWVDEHKIPLFQGGEMLDPPLVEFCLKLKTTLPNGQVVDDPRVSPELALHLNSKAKDPSLRHHLLQSLEEAEEIKQMALAINSRYAQLLEGAGWIVEDFKFEVGVLPGKGRRTFIVIDEISPDCSRIRDREGRSLTKDLFRQRRPEAEIYQGYEKLKEWVEAAYAAKY